MGTIVKLTSIMDASQWKSVRELFDAALELAPQDRPGFLSIGCADTEVRSQVERLLASHKDASAFLQMPLEGARDKVFGHLERCQPQIDTGTVLNNRYRIEEKIGSGGFGDVYLACDETLANRKVVVKSQRQGEKPQAAEWLTESFKKEMEALARIDHSGVACVYDTGHGPGGDPFLVMQYIPGKTLRAVMVPEPMGIARAANLAACIADALDAAHAVRVLHRDLKPENIILRDPDTPREAPVLIDFGIARVDSLPGSTTINVSGSPLYMAPEQLIGKAVPASDQYSLALIVFELVLGRPLYDLPARSSPAETARAALRDSKRSLPNAAKAAIVRALAFDHKERFSTAAAFAAELIPAAKKRAALAAAIACAAGLAASTIAYNVNSKPAAEILYTVSRRSNASEQLIDPNKITFRGGDGIKLRFSSATAGFLYLINEGAQSQISNPQFVVLHSAAVAARRAVVIPPGPNWIEFDEETGTDRLWMVWSATPNAQLGSLQKFLNPQSGGEVTDRAEAQRLAMLVQHWRFAITPPIYEPELNTVVLRSTAKTIITEIDLRHE